MTRGAQPQAANTLIYPALKQRLEIRTCDGTGYPQTDPPAAIPESLIRDLTAISWQRLFPSRGRIKYT